jgi:hypothetical protein
MENFPRTNNNTKTTNNAIESTMTVRYSAGPSIGFNAYNGGPFVLLLVLLTDVAEYATGFISMVLTVFHHTEAPPVDNKHYASFGPCDNSL